MKFMQMIASVVCIGASSLFSACYSPDRFRSPSGDLLVGSGNPKYQIVFESAEVVTGVNESRFELSNPPPLELHLYLVFLSREDVERLKARDAQLTIEISDAEGRAVYARHASIRDLRTPSPHPGLEVRPPDGWCAGPKGNVVREIYLWQDLDRANPQDVWAFAVPDMGVVRVDRDLRLGAMDYTLRIAVSLAGADEPPMRFYPILSGGWSGSL
ncbi:MAG TPA: hypothetical protein PKC43_08300 [Phycisphaerales bacterium]|nr:hypothetical protein [Phycisphaerales bacterium]HMP37437.1 hypothetical protein [Phycisphaerales bacterium]